jgi:hypothetical protein
MVLALQIYDVLTRYSADESPASWLRYRSCAVGAGGRRIAVHEPCRQRDHREIGLMKATSGVGDGDDGGRPLARGRAKVLGRGGVDAVRRALLDAGDLRGVHRRREAISSTPALSGATCRPPSTRQDIVNGIIKVSFGAAVSLIAVFELRPSRPPKACRARRRTVVELARDTRARFVLTVFMFHGVR